MSVRHENFDLLKSLIDESLESEFPDALLFHSDGYLPFSMEATWEGEGECEYVMAHQKLAADNMLLKGSEMTILVNSKSRTVDAVSIDRALAFDEVIIDRDNETREFKLNKNDDPNLFLKNWLKALQVHKFQKLTESEYWAQVEKYGNLERDRLRLSVVQLVDTIVKQGGVLINPSVSFIRKVTDTQK